MTDDSATAAADAAVRGVRRIFLVALVAALVAAGVTLAIELTHEKPEAATVSAPPLPLSFQQVGFVDHAVRRRQFAGFAADRRSGQLQIAAASGPLYVVVRCDTGRIQVETGALTSGQACTGKPVGVVALAQVRRPTRLTVTASRPQQTGWAVGIYR